MLSENLKRLRKECGFKQEDVAGVLGVDRSAYSYYENGKTEPSVKNLIKISRMFKVDIDTLVGNGDYAYAVSVNNESNAEYETPLNAQLKTLGNCSAEERALIALFRQVDNKEAVLDLIKSQIDITE